MPIRLLDAHTAELIAAGEVVERPASVVKELAENAIDAGATQISVEIEGGGIGRILVQDNGCGVPAGEIPLMFLRHATSKVQTQRDLEAIGTLGFRGEALASIASVARVELLTKAEADEHATRYRISGGAEEGSEPAARPGGTTLRVESLFYNTPARMKFLKKDASEGTFVGEVMTRLALSHPEISFRFARDGKQVFATPGDGVLESAVYAVLGSAFAKELVPAEGRGEGPYRVRGLVSQPHAARASRAMQFFYINGRFVKNRTMMAALEQAYRGTTMGGRFPGCVLFLEMPPELVDVNVHPAKTEVRFAREKDVFDAVYRTVKSAIGAAFGQHASLTLTGEPAEPLARAEVVPPAPARDEHAPGGDNALIPGAASRRPAPPLNTPPQAPPQAEVKAYNGLVETLASESGFIPYETKARPGPHTATAPPPPPFTQGGEAALSIDPEEVGEAVEAEAVRSVQPDELAGQTTFDAEPGEGELHLVGEVFRTYILAARGDVLILIDKHAAHERILYEKLVASRGQPDVQQLLAPVAVRLSAAEKEALLENTAALADAGLELEDFGGLDVLVRGVPADLDIGDVEGLVVDMASRLARGGQTLGARAEWVLHSVACRAAVKAGDRTPPGQLLRLAQDILDGTLPPYCPHGRPVVLTITRKELEKQFGRLL